MLYDLLFYKDMEIQNNFINRIMEKYQIEVGIKEDFIIQYWHSTLQVPNDFAGLKIPT